MNINELREALNALKWNEGRPMSDDTGVAWTAYKRLSDVPDCQCNDKAPSVHIQPYDLNINGHTFQSVEFELTGELPNGMWFNTQIHGIKYAEVIPKLDEIVSILSKAWVAANQ